MDTGQSLVDVQTFFAVLLFCLPTSRLFCPILLDIPFIPRFEKITDSEKEHRLCGARGREEKVSVIRSTLEHSFFTSTLCAVHTVKERVQTEQPVEVQTTSPENIWMANSRRRREHIWTWNTKANRGFVILETIFSSNFRPSKPTAHHIRVRTELCVQHALSPPPRWREKTLSFNI